MTAYTLLFDSIIRIAENYLLIFWTEYKSTEGKQKEHNPSNQSNCFNRDPCGYDSTANNCEASTESVAEDAANTDTVHVLPGGEDDGGQLGPVKNIWETC